MTEIEKQSQIIEDFVDKTLVGLEKNAFAMFQGSLKNIRNELLKLNEKFDWTLEDLQKYGRLDKLQAQIYEELKSISKELTKMIESTNNDIAKEAYYRTSFGFSSEFNLDFDFDILNKDVVYALANEHYPGVNISDFVNKIGSSIFENIKVAIGSNLAIGGTLIQISAQIKDILGIGYKNIERLARTEAMRAYSEAQYYASKQAEEIGIEFIKKWIATLDLRTRPNHAAMNNKLADKPGADGIFHMRGGAIGKYPHAMSVYTENINCRCRYIEQLKDYEQDLTDLSKRFSKLPEGMNYAGWLKFMGV